MRLGLPIAGPGVGGWALVLLEVLEWLEWEDLTSSLSCLLAAVALSRDCEPWDVVDLTVGIGMQLLVLEVSLQPLLLLLQPCLLLLHLLHLGLVEAQTVLNNIMVKGSQWFLFDVGVSEIITRVWVYVAHIFELSM